MLAGSFTDSAIARAAEMKGGELASTVTMKNMAVNNLIGVSGLSGGIAAHQLQEGDEDG
jgi:hypothetical protein